MTVDADNRQADIAARRARQLDQDASAMARERLRDQLAASAMCIGAAAAGLALLGYAVHTTDVQVGQIAFWGGLVIGNGGIFAALIWLYVRAERRGDTG